MSLRTRLTLIVAVIVAVAVVGGAYAAHVSTQHALNDETDKFLRDRAASFVRQPPSDHDDFGAPSRQDHEPYFAFDAVQQTIDANGTVTNSLPDQPKLPIDDADRALASRGSGSQYRDVTVDGIGDEGCLGRVGHVSTTAAGPETSARRSSESSRGSPGRCVPAVRR